MLNIGWAELLVILVVAVFAIGPKDLPRVMYQVGRLARRAQYMKYALSRQFDEVMNQVDLEDLRKHGVNLPNTPVTDELAFDEETVVEPASEPAKKPEDSHGQY